MSARRQFTDHQPHDKFVHECLSVPGLAGAVLRHFCPGDFAHQLAWEAIRIEKSEFKFAGKYGVSSHLADMLYFIPFADGQARGFHCHLEHYSKSRLPTAAATAAYRDAFFADVRRQQHAKTNPAGAEPLLWQIILLQGITPALRQALPPYASLRPNPLATVIDLGSMDDADLHAPLPAMLFCLIAKAVRCKSVMRHLPIILKHLTEVEPFSGSEHLRDVVLFYLPNGVDAIDRDAFFATIETTFPPPTIDKAMTLFDSILKEGFEQGIERGIEQGWRNGRVAAKRETLLTILTQLFRCANERGKGG